MTEKLNQIEEILNELPQEHKVLFAKVLISELKADLKSELADEMIITKSCEMYPLTREDDNIRLDDNNAILKRACWAFGAKWARDFRPKDNDEVIKSTCVHSWERIKVSCCSKCKLIEFDK